MLVHCLDVQKIHIFSLALYVHVSVYGSQYTSYTNYTYYTYYTYTLAYIHIHTYTYIHVHIHIYTHTHTYTFPFHTSYLLVELLVLCIYINLYTYIQNEVRAQIG